MELAADQGQRQSSDVCGEVKAAAYGIEQAAENGKGKARLSFLPQCVSD